MSREWLGDDKAKCSRRGWVTFQFCAELHEPRSAVRQVTEMALKRGEACDRLAADIERRGAIGDALVSVGQDVQDRLTQLVQGAAHRLIQRLQVGVDFGGGHGLHSDIGSGAVHVWPILKTDPRPVMRQSATTSCSGASLRRSRVAS